MSVPAETLGRRSHGDRVRGTAFYVLLLVSVTIGFLVLGILLVDVFRKGIGYIDPTLFNEPNSSDPNKAGAGPAIRGTIYMMVLLLVLVVPIGVGTALYLEEYANRERWYNRLLEINIQNLAAVPSIVYGILGLAFLVRGIGLGRVLLAGALILTLLVPPDRGRREPRGDPRRPGLDPPGRLRPRRDAVAGHLAPGPAGGDPRHRHGGDPRARAGDRRDGATPPRRRAHLRRREPDALGSFTALPVQIYQWIERPQEEFRLLAAAGIIVLLVILLTMNALAIVLRNRYQRRW